MGKKPASTKDKSAAASSDIYNQDGLQNVVSGLGTAKARDPYSRLGRDNNLDRIELEDFYRHYWVSKAIDIKPWDMTREWRTFSADTVDPKAIKAIEEEERKVDAPGDFRTALKWASLYGGGGVVMHVNGQGDMDEPLDYTKVKKGQLNRLSPVDRWEMIEFQGTIDYNPLSPTYGTSEWYRIATDTTNRAIHRSRIIFFRGRKMPIRLERHLKGWGDSDVQAWYKAITNSETLAASIIEGVHQANVDVVAVEGLAQLLASKDGEDKVMNRFMTMDMCKSLLNMSIIDSKDTFTRNSFPFSGLPDIYRIFLEVLASATDIPITRLLGSSPAGLNSTGESDIRTYYDMVRSRQKNDLAPKLYQLDQVLVRSALGNYPVGLEYEFNSLWQMTEEEQANVDQTRATTLSTLSNLGVDQYSLMKDAIEHGLIKNMTIEDVEAAEADDDFGIEEGNEDLGPEKGDKKEITWQTDANGKKFHMSESGKKVYKKEG